MRPQSINNAIKSKDQVAVLTGVRSEELGTPLGSGKDHCSLTTGEIITNSFTAKGVYVGVSMVELNYIVE